MFSCCRVLGVRTAKAHESVIVLAVLQVPFILKKEIDLHETSNVLSGSPSIWSRLELKSTNAFPFFDFFSAIQL